MFRRILRLPTAWRLREPYSGAARIPYVQRCRLQGPMGEREGLICDLSVRGVYVALEPIPALQESFTLSFELMTDELPLVVPSVVTWRNAGQGQKVMDLPPGCGLQFVALEARDRDRIDRLVKASAMGFPGGVPRP
jgi:hypothetical protein